MSGGWSNKVKILDKRGQGFISEPDGAFPMRWQDVTAPPIDAIFAQEISSFTLALATGESGTTTFVYDFTADTGHGIVIGDELILLDSVADRSFQCVAVNVVGDVITVDRPIDHDFPTTSLGRIVTTNMAIDGSVTPQIFTVRAGTNPRDFVRFIITILSANSMDDGKFGSLPALTNGLVFRHANGSQRTIFNFKTNGDIAQFSFDTKYPAKSPAGTYGFNGRITFGGVDKHGTVLRVSDTDVLQWIVQDDLTALTSLRTSAQGHETSEETIE